MRLTRLAPESYVRSPWKNGGGVSIDIASGWREGSARGAWSDLIWRLSRTSILAPAPFSDLAGFERCQALVSGRGLVLETPDGEIDVREPFAPVRFSGETRIVSRLEAGPVDVVNLMGARGEIEIDLRALGAGEALTLPSGVAVLYAAEGEVAVSCGDARHVVARDHGLRVESDRDPTVLACLAGRALAASMRRRG